jgi:hypothetical protein
VVDDREVGDVEDGVAGASRAAVAYGGNIPAGHCLHEVCARGLGGAESAGDLSVTQDGDLIADGQHFVDLVGHQNHRGAGVRGTPNHGEQRSDFARRQHGGGLVENENACVTVQRFENLDPLLGSDRQRPHNGGRIDLESIARGEFVHPRVGSLAVDETVAARFCAIDDVLGDGH